MATFDPREILTDELLERFRQRAAVHDRENTFPDDDLADLEDAGYLAILVPRELGGRGLGLAEASVLQQRLAGAAPATALAINMHLVWTGVAKVLADRGVDALRFVQEGAAAGEVFAFGISEAGNDLVLFGSGTDAAPLPDGGYAFTGTKIFTSLAPVWTQLGLHGLDATSDDAPQMVYAFVPRSYDALPPQLESLARDVDTLADHGARWFSLLAGVKHRAVTAAKAIVDEAVLVAGGSSYFTANELSRLYRDVLAGLFHPSDPESAHSTVATAWLGPLED